MEHPATSLSLLERAQSGQEQSWRDITLLYAPLIYYWCRCAGVEGRDAEDIWATVLGKTFEKLANFQHNGRPGAFRNWLRVMTQHVIADARSNTIGLQLDQNEFIEQIPDELEESTKRSPADEEIVLYNRAWELIRSEFSTRDQNVFRRIIENGEAPKDVADDLGLKRSVVYTLVGRIKKRLVQRFAGEIEA